VPVVLVVAALLVAPPALGVLGTLLADVPYVGLAAAYVPWYLPWLTVASVAGGVLALIGWRLRHSRVAAVLAVVAALTVAGSSVITARMTAAVEHAGADISLIDTFGIGMPRQAASDDEATYTTFDGQPCACPSTARADPLRAHRFSSTSMEVDGSPVTAAPTALT